MPTDVRKHFNNKLVFSKSLETTNYVITVSRAEPIMQERKELIAAARKKYKGEVVDFDESVKAAKARMKSFNDGYQIIAAAAHDLNYRQDELAPVQRAEKLAVIGQAARKMTPILKYLEDWLSETRYTKAGEDDARNYFKKRFVKVFKYWETIDQNELKAYVRGRQDGSDGDRAWSDRTCEKNLNLVKQFWNWMLDNDHVECPNLIDAARLMKRKANTKTNRSETNADANLPYSIEECGAFVDAAKKDGYNMLPELIVLGMYTGCRIEELCALKLEDVGPDYFAIQDGKTEASQRRLPVHSAIKQMVERLMQDSKNGYLLSGLSSKTRYNYRSAAISKKLGYLKKSMGFSDRKQTFHSLKATLITRLMNVKADSTLSKKLVGHKIQDLTWGGYAGDADWDKKLEIQVCYLPKTQT